MSANATPAAGSVGPHHLRALMQRAAFRDIEVRVGARTAGDPFVALIAAGTKPPTASVTNGARELLRAGRAARAPRVPLKRRARSR